MNTTKYTSIKLKITELDGNVNQFRLRVVNEGYILYFNCQHLLVQLGTDARCFFDYLCEKMSTDKNEVTLNAGFKKTFVSHINNITIGKVKPAINSLSSYVSDFKALGLIISTTGTQREYYTVNPRYAYKGLKKDRLRLLASIINDKIRNKESLRGLVDKPETELGINYDGIM